MSFGRKWIGVDTRIVKGSPDRSQADSSRRRRAAEVLQL